MKIDYHPFITKEVVDYANYFITNTEVIAKGFGLKALHAKDILRRLKTLDHIELLHIAEMNMRNNPEATPLAY